MDASFFRREIEKLQGDKKISAQRAFILCPFHQETKPSGSVSFDTSRPQYLGWYKCWGCGKSCDWDQLAEKTGLKKLNGHRAAPKHADGIDIDAINRRLLAPKQKETMKDFDLFDLQEPKWRGFKRSFLEKFEAKHAYHDQSKRFYMWFPVIVKDETVGYFRALMQPVDGIPSYFNKPGEWVKKYGLFPFDQAVLLMKRKKLKTMTLVEGPRDALRLIRLGIPAVAVLGTNNWTNTKLFLLESVGVQKIVLMMDGDKPGRVATKQLHKKLKSVIRVKTIRLWRVARKLGKSKIDPYSAPKNVILKYKKYLT